jgi:hypothetical protein
MGGVGLLARAALRGGWRGALVVALLIGIAGGAVLTAWAGARRTSSAFERARAESKSPDVLASAVYDFTSGHVPDISDLTRLPQLQTAGRLSGIGLAPYDATGKPVDIGLLAVAPTSDEPLHAILRPQLISGRYPVAADEVTVSREAVSDLARLGIAVHVGSRVRVAYFAFQDVATDAADAFHPIELRVVGIAQTPEQRFASVQTGRREVVLSEAFGLRHRDSAGFHLVVGRLAPGHDAASFIRAARAAHPDVDLGFQTRDQNIGQYNALARPYVDALRLFALIAGLASLLVVGQALVRQERADARAVAAVRALGLRHAESAAAVAARSLVSIAAGLVLAAVGATIASRWFPIGPARLVTIDRHFSVDGWATAQFLLVAAVGLGAIVLASALVATRTVDHAPAAARRVRALSELRFQPPAWTGVRRAFADVGGDKPSAAATIGGLVVAAATVAAALTFAFGLDKFVTEPARWGWHWDAIYDAGDNAFDLEAVATMVRAPEVRGLTVGARGAVTSNGRTSVAYGLDVRKGAVGPDVQRGRLPRRASEIALAPRTLTAFRTHVGGSVPLATPDGKTVAYHVVGTVAVPPSLDLSDLQRLGYGAVLTGAGLRRVEPHVAPSFALLDLPRGFDDLRRLDRAWSQFGGRLAHTEIPVEISSYAHVRSTPIVLAALLALLGLGVLAHALALSARADRAQFAVLRSLGFLRRQVMASMSWQATALLSVGGGVGVLLGVATGRWLWHRFVEDLGLTAGAVVPVLALLAASLVAFVIANIVAVWCALRAVRETAATGLRAE